MRMRNAARLSTIFTMRRHFEGGVYTAQPLSSAATFRGRRQFDVRRHFEEIRYHMETTVFNKMLCVSISTCTCMYIHVRVRTPEIALCPALCSMSTDTLHACAIKTDINHQIFDELC